MAEQLQEHQAEAVTFIVKNLVDLARVFGVELSADAARKEVIKMVLPQTGKPGTPLKGSDA